MPQFSDDQMPALKRPLSRRTLMQNGLAFGGTLVAGSAVAEFLAACGGSSQSSSGSVTPQEVRSATGTIHVLTFNFYEVPEINSGPVKAEYSEAGDASHIIAKTRPASSGLDVINAGGGAMSQLYALDRLLPIDTAAVPNYAHIEPTLRDNPQFSQNGKVYVVPFAVAPGLTAWDSSKVPAPTSANSLLGPVYRDSIGLLDESDTLITVAQLLGFDIYHYTLTDLDQVKSYLDQLKPNIKTLFAFGDEEGLFARGDISVCYQTYGTLLTGAQESNPAITGSLLGSTSYVDGWSVVDGADVAASLNWINNTLTVPAQIALQEGSGGFPSVNRATKPSLQPAELRNLSLAEVIKRSPPNPGVPNEGNGLVTRDILDSTWDDYKASFG